MASTTQDELYQTFLAVSGQQTSALGDATAMLADVIAQVDELQSSNPAPVAATKTQSTTASSSDGGSTLGSVASSVLESGFGLAPLISGLVSLFSGGDTAAPAPLVKYAMPAAVDFQAAESQGQVTGVDYDQTGMPRSYAPAGASAGAAAVRTAARVVRRAARRRRSRSTCRRWMRGPLWTGATTLRWRCGTRC